MKSILLILSFFFGLNLSFAEIREAKSVEEISHEVDSHTLLVADLDNTVMKPKQSLGSDQWLFYLTRKIAREKKQSIETALTKVIPIWEKIQRSTDMEPVEKNTVSFFEESRKKGAIVIGLTARSATEASFTVKQLSQIGMSFDKFPVYGSDLSFNLVVPVLYTKGILYITERNKKGQALVEFLQRIRYKMHAFTKIVFMDDKAKHTQSVEEALNEWQKRSSELKELKHIEFRYGAADRWVNSFDPKAANVEYEVFESSGKFLPDDEAKKLAGEKK